MPGYGAFDKGGSGRGGFAANRRWRNPAGRGKLRAMNVAQANAKRARFDQIMSLVRTGDLDEAHRLLETVRRLDPQELNFLNLAAWLAGLRGDHDRSIALYRQIVQRMPANQEARFNLLRAEAIKAEGGQDLSAALGALREALAITPHDGALQAQIALLQRQLCDFAAPAMPAQAVLSPADAIVLEPDPAIQHTIARAWAGRQFAAIRPLLPPARRDSGAPLRLGFLSSDFHEHATAYLIAELFALFDRRDFTVHAYSYGHDDNSAIRDRIRQSCDSFTDLRTLNARDAALRVRGDVIDVLIDLKGYTRGGRLDIAAFRPAPVQMHWLGFPGTLGCDFIDYFIADPAVLPPAQAQHFSEKIIWLPDSYQINDRQRPLPPPLSRAYYGLPDEAVIFASFNQTYKFTKELLDLWAEILRAVPSGILWLLASNSAAPDNIRAYLAGQGVEGGRVAFAAPCSLPGHLQRYHVVDVALDPFPVGGHTTTSDALWLGAPVVTLPVENFAGRVAAGLLKAVQLDELIAEDSAHYRALAVDLAQNRARRDKIRQHLTDNRMQLPLFDSAFFAKNLASGLKSAWRRYEQGMPPDHIAVISSKNDNR